KLFETVHQVQAQGKTIDAQLYDRAKEFYEEAFYRSLFMGAENSVGFHNPAEGLRILGDSVAFGTRAEAYLRQALTQAGVEVPLKVDLEIMKYVDQRGEKKLRFDPSLEFKDPYGLQEKFF
ncbi:MAG: ammonia-forming cytochrome c nitrite reductase subunit c552, partial [Desulfobacteraceae bacterium]